MKAALPEALARWRETPRVRPLNDRAPEKNGRYVLCWLQQALRARDNPVIDAAFRLGNARLRASSWDMKKSRYTEEQIAFALKQAETGTPVAEVIRRTGVPSRRSTVGRRCTAD